ncbi:MAG TPA: adenylate/guanylate cyclase domain-containing protein [Acetobacteraceae bacterium]|nr:adenylate/guanylate cyclase domain-containing protein [Acetobacteraceae bacterium]
MDVAEWLRALDLTQYAAAFHENSISADLLPRLTADDLRDLGVTSVGHRRRLLDAIAALRAGAGAESHAGAIAEEAQRRPPPGAERRQVTVMFCDMVNFTALSAELDPEDLSAVIRGYQATVAATIDRSGGFIARYVGDGVLIYFGWPEAREADAERAVRAGLAVVREIGQAPSGGVRVALRIGIATGLVVIGEPIGAGDARQQTAIGETPNLAARLQALAGDDGIVIDAETHRQIGRLFDCTDLGRLTLKGIPGQVQAWQVLKEAAIGSRFEALHDRSLSPLVGRDEEIDLLMRRWEQAKGGSGRVVLIVGEPGIGKSRLVAELEARLRDQDHARLRYFCSPDYSDAPLHPIVRQMALAAELDRADAHEAKSQRLRALLGAGTERADVAALGALLGVDEAGGKRSSARLHKERIFAALLRQAERLCRERPLLALVEDVHWADPTTRELIDLAVTRMAEMRGLLVLTLRPELQVPWTGHAGVTSITLSRLDRNESTALAGVLATEDLPPVLLQRIAQQADGVPLFIEELTKDWVERARDPDATLQTIGVPTTLQGSLLARLDRLPDAKQVAQVGSVIGREFSHELISTAADLPDDVFASGLEQLVSSGLAQRRGEPPAAIYRFKHALVQRAVYSTLLRANRQRLHGLVADALSAQPDPAPQILAHHLTEAGRMPEAVKHWLRAGQRLAGRSAEREAISLFRRGLAALLTLPEGRDRDQRELEFNMALGMPLVTTEGYGTDVVRAVYERIAELSERLGDTRSLLIATYGTFVSCVAQGDNRQATAISERASIRFANAGEPVGRLILHRMAGFAAFQAGRFREARHQLEAVLELYDPDVHASLAGTWGHDARVAALDYLSHTVWLLGYPDQACHLMDQAFEAARQVAHAGSIGHARYFAGILFADLRRDAAALRHHLDAAQEFDREYARPGYSVSFFHGMSLCDQGMPADGLALAERSLAQPPNSGGERRTYILGRLAAAYAAAEQLDRGWQTISEAQALSARSAERSWDAELERIAGEIQRARTGGGSAEAHLRLAIDTARQQGAKSLELRAAVSLARLLQHQERQAEARQLLAVAYAGFTEGFDTPDLRDASALLSELAGEPYHPAQRSGGPT